MKLIAILPMKANSERVKGKNFKILGEKPLFKWILDTLLFLTRHRRYAMIRLCATQPLSSATLLHDP